MCPRSVFMMQSRLIVGMSAKGSDIPERQKKNEDALLWRERFGVSAGVFLLGLASFRRSPLYGLTLVIAGTTGMVVSFLFLSLAEDTGNGLYDREPPFEQPREINDAFRDR